MPRSSRWSRGRPLFEGRPALARRRVLRIATLGDSGSAALEFIAVGVLMLVPLTYLIIALGSIQGQTMGVEAAARFAARAAVQQAGASTEAAVDGAVLGVTEQYGIDAASLDVSMRCRPAGGPCPAAGATVVIEVRAEVPLPLMPPVLGLNDIATVPVEASAVQKVSRFWGTG